MTGQPPDASDASPETRQADAAEAWPEVPPPAPADLRRVIHDGVASQIMATLTGGPFLVAYALALGANNLFIGLLAAASPLAQVAQVPAVWIIERVRDRRKVTLAAAAVSRLFWVVMAAAAFLAGPFALTLVLVAIVFHFMFGGIAGTAWNSWMRDLIPERIMGSFFARRLGYTHAVALPLLLVAGFFVDEAGRRNPGSPLVGYQVLFVLGAAAGFAGLLFLKGTPEPPMPDREHLELRTLLRRPLKDQNFRRLLHFLIAWNFALNLAAPFFTVYLLQQLGYSLLVVVGLTVLSQLVHLLFLRLWGRTIDQYGNRLVLLLCGPVFLLALLVWTFTTFPDAHRFTMELVVLVHILVGLSTAGTALAASNIVLKLAPRGHGTSYMATAALASAAAGAAGPLLGGALADFLAQSQLDVRLAWSGPTGAWDLPTLSLQSWDFFFAVALVFGAYALHRLTGVHETGPSGEPVAMAVFFSDLRQEMRNMSTVAGIRTLVQYPITLLQSPRARRRR